MESLSGKNGDFVKHHGKEHLMCTRIIENINNETKQAKMQTDKRKNLHQKDAYTKSYF